MLYDILVGTSVVALKTQVNTLLADGWVLHGAPMIWPEHSEGQQCLVQAMTKDDEAAERAEDPAPCGNRTCMRNDDRNCCKGANYADACDTRS